MDRWGLVSTIKAPVADILAFAAYHIDLGAHRLYLFLDAPDPVAYSLLKAHPKVRVFTCDSRHWHRLGKARPAKHQVRQCLNASWAYNRASEVDWLAHIDVDEYLWPRGSLTGDLSALPPDATCARVRPIEALDGQSDVFKGFIPSGPNRRKTVNRLYPTYGHFVPGGFLSHLAGKLLVRTGLPDVTIRIHNLYVGSRMNPGEQPLETVDLCHRHVRGWDPWIETYRFRMSLGAYRSGLNPAGTGDGPSLHDALAAIEREQGKSGLRKFFDELCCDTPALRNRLSKEGLLRRRNLDLTAKLNRHFPDFEQIVPNSSPDGA